MIAEVVERLTSELRKLFYLAKQHFHPERIFFGSKYYELVPDGVTFLEITKSQ